MKKKKYKIWGTPWHLAHNYDLCKALERDADFYMLVNYTRRWDEKLRPIPKNVHWVMNFEKGKYDFAILHVDQQCSTEGLNKGMLIKHMKETIKKVEPSLPIVFINHATPVYPENFQDGTRATGYKSEILRKEILNIVGDDLMITNSKQAAKDWKRGYPIWHGMEEKEWMCFDEKEPRVATFISRAGIGDKYYNRSYLVAVMDELRDRFGISLQWINTDGCFNAKDHKDYKEFLGKTLLYFNPTFASPMPRTRTEAMLSGCCVLTTPHHDADEFIEDGVNGFLVPHNDPRGVAENINILLKDGYKQAKEVGMRGRETAIKTFNRERYRQDWLDFIKTQLLK